MKKQLKILFILLTIAFSIFNFANRTLFTTVNATYVEGPITQDTIWTLVDSPFVVSKDVIVYPNSTLTIEPGVEVKFGGPFSLIVSGILYANGTEKTITFTSNKEQPEVGDWEAITFNGTGTSVLIGCFVAYAKDGIFVENSNVELENSAIIHCQSGITVANGKLTIENSTVSLCAQSGINITNSDSTVQNSLIAENQENGIRITGNGQITIQKNTILANGDGILLTGDEISGVNITQNKISANKQSGIRIDANNTDVTIRNNIVSKNDKGFYISSPKSTYITRNYVSNNTVGIYYESGINHEAHFNDIYDNDLGMDASPTATVDATYNYWGNRSGPLHESLNPHGKGNPVGGDGMNLDFVFFLSQPIDSNNTRPTAVLWTDKILVAPNQNVTFIGTDSHDDGRVDQYFFDFGDGTNSGWVTLSLFNHSYSSNGTYTVSLTVIDDFNVTSDSTLTTISVQDLTSLEASVALNTYSVNYNEEASITVYVSDGINAVENANVTLFSVKGGFFTSQSGLTNSTGHFTATFIAPNVTELTNVRIIVRVSKTGYADGSDYNYLKVLPPLKVQITTEPTTIKSEETASVIVYVTGSFEEPVADASVVFTVDYGNLSANAGVTDLNGMAVINFTAPQTLSQMNVTIAATAMKMGYAEGHGQKIITVEPKTLAVQVTAKPNVTISEANVNVTVHVEYDATSIAGANITMEAENGNFSMFTQLTDAYGNATFVFTAPQVNEQSDITITARATKARYAERLGQLEITVNPRTFNIQISAPTLESGEQADVVVNVTCKEDATPVAGTVVTVSSREGNFSVITKTTDTTGTCTFVFDAPQTTEQISIVITANVTKNGYIDGGNQTTITVNPKTVPQAEGGWPITTMLLIIIPIIIAVVVVILIKLKIIVLSTGEEE